MNNEYSLSIHGKNDGEDLTFNVPALQKIIKINDKEVVNYQIELVIDDYILIALDSEMELLNPPSATIGKLTQIKQEVKEERKPIQIKEKQIFKEKSAFQKDFSAFVELRNKREKEKI